MIKREDVVPGARASVKKTKRNDFSFWLAPNNDPTDIGDQFSTLGMSVPAGTCFEILTKPFKATGVSGMFVNIKIDDDERVFQTFYVDVHRKAVLI